MSLSVLLKFTALKQVQNVLNFARYYVVLEVLFVFCREIEVDLSGFLVIEMLRVLRFYSE